MLLTVHSGCILMAFCRKGNAEIAEDSLRSGELSSFLSAFLLCGLCVQNVSLIEHGIPHRLRRKAVWRENVRPNEISRNWLLESSLGRFA
jgi:hypothetical protein